MNTCVVSYPSNCYLKRQTKKKYDKTEPHLLGFACRNVEMSQRYNIMLTCDALPNIVLSRCVDPDVLAQKMLPFTFM